MTAAMASVGVVAAPVAAAEKIAARRRGAHTAAAVGGVDAGASTVVGARATVGAAARWELRREAGPRARDRGAALVAASAAAAAGGASDDVPRETETEEYDPPWTTPARPTACSARCGSSSDRTPSEGTILGTTAIVTRCLLANPELFNLSLVPRAVLGLVALLCGNGYIVGINQIYDVDIDKVNKPFLPVAAGELSVPLAWTACAAFAVAGASIVAANFGPLITQLYCFGLFLGTIYSVPPSASSARRWRRL